MDYHISNPTIAREMAQKKELYNHQQQQHEASRKEQTMMLTFWTEQLQACEAIDPATENFREACLPLKEVTTIMRDEDSLSEGNGGARLSISPEAPVLLAKACELLVAEVVLRAEEQRKQSHSSNKDLQRDDIRKAVTNTDTFDFLIDILLQGSGSSSTISSRDKADVMPLLSPAIPTPTAVRMVPPFGGVDGNSAALLAPSPSHLAPLSAQQRQQLAIQQQQQQQQQRMRNIREMEGFPPQPHVAGGMMHGSEAAMHMAWQHPMAQAHLMHHHHHQQQQHQQQAYHQQQQHHQYEQQQQQQQMQQQLAQGQGRGDAHQYGYQQHYGQGEQGRIRHSDNAERGEGGGRGGAHKRQREEGRKEGTERGETGGYSHQGSSSQGEDGPSGRQGWAGGGGGGAYPDQPPAAGGRDAPQGSRHPPHQHR